MMAPIPMRVAGVRAMSQLVREQRLQIMLTPEELAALDDFRYKQRIPSRAAAVRELLRRGLGVEAYGPSRAGVKSADFGVLYDDVRGSRRRTNSA
jgi:hypothetical protein